MEQLIHAVLQNVICSSDQNLQLQCDILVHFRSGDFNEVCAKVTSGKTTLFIA
jgi:hypothetical protein